MRMLNERSGPISVGSRVDVVVYENAVQANIKANPEITEQIIARANQIMDRARQIYMSRQMGETSLTDDRGVSPGLLYESTLHVTQLGDNVVSIDTGNPTGHWVESGAHPGGGNTRVLGYTPLRGALDWAESTAGTPNSVRGAGVSFGGGGGGGGGGRGGLIGQIIRQASRGIS